jgi:hypothetical protein
MKKKTHKSVHRFKWWYQPSILAISLLIVLCTSSCGKEEGINPNDEYYVKYEVNSSTIYTGGKLDLTIRTEKNEDLTLVINQRTLHETIIGPVEKGFNANMAVLAQGETFNRLKLYTNIYVSKNGSPFALKKTDGSEEPRDSVNLIYVIDY